MGHGTESHGINVAAPTQHTETLQIEDHRTTGDGHRVAVLGVVVEEDAEAGAVQGNEPAAEGLWAEWGRCSQLATKQAGERKCAVVDCYSMMTEGDDDVLNLRVWLGTKGLTSRGADR